MARGISLRVVTGGEAGGINTSVIFGPSGESFTVEMKVAVVGSGVSGISAVWALNEYSEHEVHLFEANDYLGGHTHTVQFKRGNVTTNVDTGFIVSTFPAASIWDPL